MLAGLNAGPGHELVACNSARIYDMIFTQPVCYELSLLQVPTLLMIGTADATTTRAQGPAGTLRCARAC